MQVRAIETDEAIAAAFDVMRELRPHLVAAAFLATIRAQQADGYRLVGAFDARGTVRALAGYRISRTLFRGEHLFVDDLVTTAAERGNGYGTLLLAWLARLAVERGIAEVWLDSRSTATGFYAGLGFELRSSVPCSIAATTLAARAVAPKVPHL